MLPDTTVTSLANITNRSVILRLETAFIFNDIEDASELVEHLFAASDKVLDVKTAMDKITKGWITFHDGSAIITKLDNELKSLYEKVIENKRVRDLLPSYGIDPKAIMAYYGIIFHE